MYGKYEQLTLSTCLSPELLLQHLIHPEELSEEQCKAISWHIAHCEHCADKYSSICDANAELWVEVVRSACITEKTSIATRTAQEALSDFWKQIDEKEGVKSSLHTECQSVYRIGKIIAGLAACIALGLLTVWAVSTVLSPTQPQAVKVVDAALSTIEHVTASGRQVLPADKPIRSTQGTMELLLGNKHKVILNSNTTVIITTHPIAEGRQVAWSLNLESGELYAEVVPHLPGGTEFEVVTPNALATITGTKFDIHTQDQATELTLLKGSVRFAQLGDANSVNVTTGYASKVIGQQAPSVPALVDALVTTAWAREPKLDNVVGSAQMKVDADLDGLLGTSENFLWQANLPDVDTLDYESWRDANRQGRLAQTALAALPKDKAANADWIEVLMVSGSIWQFQFDLNRPIDLPCAKIEQANIICLSRYIGIDKQTIRKALGLPESVLAITPNLQDEPHGLLYTEALQHWHDAVITVQSDKPAALSDIKLFSLHASQYLAQTRTAAYLWGKHNPEMARSLLADKAYLTMLPTPPILAGNDAPDVNDWLKQLREQANAARHCVPTAMEWLLVSSEIGCTTKVSGRCHRRLAGWVSHLVTLDDQVSSP